jgi:sugar phosphate isomerase/epimerase
MNEEGRSRRLFLGKASAAACSAAIGSPAGAHAAPLPASRGVAPARGPYAGKLCFFSKPLPDMDWRRLARSAKRLGFDGLDLTVRKGGHVLPERAALDLPRAFATAREEGLDVPMITTALTSADDPAARAVLETAAGLGIPFFKAGYYLYAHVDVRAEREQAGLEFRRLVELATRCGIQAGYHNHSEYVGAAVWDAASFIEPLDPRWAGYYFDARHAVAEGGAGAWETACHLVASRLKMVAVKDFRWEKTPKGWQDKNCPLGEGMVDWRYVLGVFAQAGFQGPLSLHLEYEVPGSTTAAHEENILVAAQRDLAFLKERLREAYGVA